jgi:chromosome segregation ATPase
VRASSLHELVYKGGQAGVTKATVTITFDNSDKKQSPVGYETFDEITVSRQVKDTIFIKYWIKFGLPVQVQTSR